MGLFFVFHILYSLFFSSKCFVQMSYCFLVSFDFVSSFHFGHDVVEVDACVFPEDEEVVEEVAGFGGDFFFVFVLVGDDDFAGFFSDFLVDFVAAFGKEVVRVGFGLGIFLSVFDFLAEGVEDGKGPFCFLVRKSLDAAEEAGAVSCVAGGAFGEDLGYDGVFVAVDVKALDVLDVAGFFAFVPEFLAAPAVEPGFSCFEGLL